MPSAASAQPDPGQQARALSLRYVYSDEPGYTRRRQGSGFSYLTPRGKRVTDADLREWFASLAIPPAWEDVWICRYRNGHLLVTGRDAKQRKQYIYHPDWRAYRQQTTFDRLQTFGSSLELIRRRIDQDLRRHGLPRERVTAAAVRLMDEALLRVGDPAYTRENGSYGLTTLLDEHADLGTARVKLEFTAKSGKQRCVSLQDRRLARILSQCEALPGQRLLQYRDEDDDLRPLGSEDVNGYLAQASGLDVTAKDFRTWGGTVATYESLCGISDDVKPDQAIRDAVTEAGSRLGNTAAVARRHYVHPAVIERFESGQLPHPGKGGRWLDRYEVGVLKLLRSTSAKGRSKSK